MGRFSVGLLSFAFASVSILAGAPAHAGGDHHDHCTEIDRPAVITTDRKCVRVEERVEGDIRNTATVGRDTSEIPGFFIGDGGLVTGALINDGTIKGGGGTWGALTLGRGADVKGGIVNNGTIASAEGDAIRLGYLMPGYGYGSRIRAAALTGDIVNNGVITGTENGIAALYGTMTGTLINASGGHIEGDVGVFLAGTFTSWTGGIVNRGTIEGDTGAIIIETPLFAGGLVNAAGATIRGHDGDGIFADTVWQGVFDNQGTIEGRRGFAFAGADFHGAITNGGAILGDATGLSLTAATATGGLHNTGTIKGTTEKGVLIDVETWGAADERADIVNTASGRIEGGQTGFWFRAGSIFGDVVNDGRIAGGGTNTGLRVEANLFDGDIVNNGVLTAPSNALELLIETLTGSVKNRGRIEATDANGIAAALAILNGATFANEQGGLIIGDLRLGGQAAYTFIGRDGGMEGSIIGNAGLAASAPRDDVVLIEDGTQFFVDGALENLLRVTVADGGVALMGAREIGDANGPGYGATNVDALAVNEGGRLYLDDDTVLNVGTFTQAPGGELTYYLVAPAGTPVAGQDYGRIDASGAVTLAGKLSVILDAASFGGTTQTAFHYADIIKGASFAGEFDDLEIEGSSYFFRLELTYGATALGLGVTRTPFDQTFCEAHLSQNSKNLGAAIEAAFQAGGFTPEQIALFNFLGQLEDVCGAYFDLGGAVLGDVNAITIETAGPWKSAVNDRLNSTGATSCVVAGAGGCLTRYAQNEAAGTLSDAEDPFAWLRTGVRPEGQFSFWGRLLGVQGDNRGRNGAAGSDFTVTGGIAGADYVVTQRMIVGAAAQWTTTDVDFKKRGDTADVQSLEVGGYFSYGDAEFCLNGNASIIFHDFDTYRFPFGGTAQGAYEGTTVSAYVEAGSVIEFDALRIEPVLALSFAALDTDAYGETGSAVDLLLVEGASHRSLKSALGARFAYPIALLTSGRKIVPEARLMWAHEFLDDRSEFRTALSSLPNHSFTVVGQRFSRDSLLAGAGLNVPLSANAVLYADYDLSWSSDRVIQSVSLGARMSW